MLDEQDPTTTINTTGSSGASADASDAGVPAKKAAAKRATRATAKKAPAKKTTAKKTSKKAASSADVAAGLSGDDQAPAAKKSAAKKTTTKKTAAKKTAKKAASSADNADVDGSSGDKTDAGALAMPLFRAPDPVAAPASRRSTRAKDTAAAPGADDAATKDDAQQDSGDVEQDEDGGSTRRRRSRGGRNRRKSGSDGDQTDQTGQDDSGSGTDAKDAKSSKRSKSAKSDKSDKSDKDSGADDDEGASSRRRRRRRRSGEDSGGGQDDPAGTTTKVRQPRAKKESITSVEGSTRIEAKKQRRREGREAGRRRPPILSESEFLARRESVERVMAIRQRGETTQIAVLEDDVLVEHYVALESQSSIIGNVYLGRVQNVLPSMEAAFVDIGKGRNAVLYAGEVNWDLRGDKNQPRRIENALKPGQSVLVQVSKDPIGHKGARLTSQISLPGRYLVYVPGGGTNGISRKLPDTERNRLKNLLKDILPDEAGVIIRTAAEGASEDELTRDVTRLTARWEDIEKKSESGQAPTLLYAEPDTTLKVVRDLFTEDFSTLVIAGDDAWDMVDGYVQHVAPDLSERLERYDGAKDIFASFRIDEQISKALERKVWLPSGGSLVIDRTEAMTVVDVNTGKFTGSGGNLEETVTKNNLEAAEEIVRQIRLRDIGGIIVIDFIDMVLENNRDLVLRRLVECLGRDRTRHQVAEVTSLGLVQMTRKRISTGLLEAFSHSCEHCQGRGVIVEGEPVDPKKHEEHDHGSSGSRSSKRSSNRRRGGRRGGEGDDSGSDDEESQDTATGDTSSADDTAPESSSDSQPDSQPDSKRGRRGGTSGRASTSDDGATDVTDTASTSNAAPVESTPTAQPAQQPSRGPAADELPSATTPRSRRRRRASRPTGAPSSPST